MFSSSRKAFGTTLEVLIPKDSEFDVSVAAEAAREVFNLFDKFDLVFSRFNDMSELSILNSTRKAKVSDIFLKLLNFAVNFSKETDFVFNPLINLSSIGYSKDFQSGKFSKTDKNYSLNIDDIVINNSSGFVELKNDAFLDLGGCAKGFAVDEAVKIVKKYFRNFLINAGGDLYASGKFHGEKWQVGVENPFNENEDFDVLEVEDFAVATSGSYRRRWTIDGKNYHHIVSGKTNEPADEGIVSVTVCAEDALSADVFAKTVFILGRDKGGKFLVKKGIKGIIFPL